MIVVFAGLAVSIPLVFFGNRLVCHIMETYPLLIYIGATILAILGGKMILTDGVIERTFHIQTPSQHVVELAAVIAVLTSGYFVRAYAKSKANSC